MEYSKIVNQIDCEIVKNNIDVQLSTICIDTRKCIENSMYVCIKGTHVDGHDLVQSAYDNGARIFVVNRDVDIDKEDVVIIKVDNTRKSLAEIAKYVYDNIDEQLNIIGVTGTNGKTSTVNFINQILQKDNHKTTSIGTLGIFIDNEQRDELMVASTTPEFVDFMEILKLSKQHNVTDVLMEVSSHGLELYKVYGVKFDVGVFTNLTQDHLDFHKDMEEYFEAKAKLFKQCDCAIINVDDEYGKKLVDIATGKVVTFGIDSTADYVASNIVLKPDSVEFTLNHNDEQYEFSVNVPGKFTVYNMVGSILTVLNSTDLSMREVQQLVSKCKGVPGRVNAVPNDKGFTVLVDYAHTDDALKNVISTVKETTENRVITVFGCGGDRDRTKRPKMAKVATELSDFTVITSDNPRTENPDDIVKDVETGVVNDKYKCIVDRREAIRYAISIAEKGDTVIIAGKGHEDYQIIGTKKIHFDDYEEAKNILEG